MTRLRKILHLTALAGGAASATAAYGIYEHGSFNLEIVDLPLLEPGVLRRRDSLDRRESFDILHLTDIHLLPWQLRKITFIRSLASLHPDLVINTGDNLGHMKAVPPLLQGLDPLLRIPGAFVFGSNDYYAPRPVNPFAYLWGARHAPSTEELPWRDMRAAFVEHGWHDATHRRVEIKVSGLRLAIAGVDDPHHDWDDYSRVAGSPHPDADLSIALTHAPEPRVLAAFAADGYQLSISGHTHGGQLCLPGGRPIVTNCGIDRSRAQGVHDFDGMTMYVSRGLGTSRYAPFRTFCPPTATLLRVTEKTGDDAPPCNPR